MQADHARQLRHQPAAGEWLALRSPGELMAALVTGGLVAARGSESQTMDALAVSREEGQQHVAAAVQCLSIRLKLKAEQTFDH